MAIIPVAIFLIFFLILSMPILAVQKVREKRATKKVRLRSLRVVQWAFKVIIKLTGCRAEVIGLENVPKDEAVLYVANHRGVFDIVYCYSMCPNLTGFIAKNTTERYPLLRDWMKQLYCLFLDRDDTRDGLRVVLAAIEYIKDGISVFIFPEGTRTKDGSTAEFKEGSFKIATKTGAKIIPIAISNTEAIFEDQFPRLKPEKVVIHYGEPIDVTKLGAEDKKRIGAYTRDIIEKMRLEDEIRLFARQ